MIILFKKVFIYPVCPVCGCEDESACHLFINCRFAQDCWRSAGIAFVSYAGTKVVDWVKSWLVVADKESACVISMVCWHIWSNRNSIVWSEKRLEVLDVLNMAGCQLTAWRKARESNPAKDNVNLVREDGRLKWVRPAEGVLKVNVDASCRNDGRSIGVGITVRNSSGVLVQARAVNFLGNHDPRVAKIMGIREALSWVKTDQRVVVESDAMEVVLAIRNSGVAETDLLVLDCVELAKQFINLRFVFVRRSANQPAHVLAQFARSLSGHQDWFNHYPGFLTAVVAMDLI
ncbi:uncharacterized protein LOC126687573 [Mercurialis annua]|uniref:uncharacterized protein LOC126687573 n=1 Tax=Mercurialis annua TaxID=3986 RepID=UPI00216078F8|nr:uncharacterized protein LOC126687573 [Mercurialis annua]